MTPLPAVAPEHTVSALDSLRPSPAHSPTCQHPVCVRPPVHRHHIVPRGKLGGAYDFITIDDIVVVNVLDLCFDHHDALESQPGGCKARLRWLGPKIQWGWYDRWVEMDASFAVILWVDPRSGSAWKFRGFVRVYARA